MHPIAIAYHDKKTHKDNAFAIWVKNNLTHEEIEEEVYKELKEHYKLDMKELKQRVEIILYG